MKILHVINDLRVGGAERMLVDLCRLMAERGHDVHVLTLGEVVSPIVGLLLKSGAHHHVSGYSSAYDPRNIFALRRTLKLGSFDAVHVHLFPAQLWAAASLVGTASATPFFTTEHNTWNRRRDYPLAWLDRWIYQRYGRVAAISEGVKDTLNSWLNPADLGVVVVPNGIDLQRFMAPAKPVSLPGSQRFKALCVGTLTERKNHARLLDALVNVPMLDLILLGSGELKARLCQQAEMLGISERVHFLGTRDDVPNVLASVDLYVQPSRVEGFGIAALEAMAAGLPVLASDVAGLCEVIGDAGRLIDHNSTESWSRELNDMLRQPRLRALLGELARARARSFGVETTVSRYLDLYQVAAPRKYRRTFAGLAGSGSTEWKGPTA